jgi:uncharacterized protein
MTMRYAVIYESAEDAREKARTHFPAHKARWSEYQERGELLMIGTFSDGSGAMGIFTTLDAAEEFVNGDPFLIHGVIRSWQIKEWNEVLGD